MKKFLTLTIIALIALIGLTTNVQAAEATTWAELEAALNGADDEISFTGLQSELTISDEKTLNLNGKTLTVTDGLVVNNGGKLTITGNGKITTSTASQIILVNCGGTLLMENGSLESTTVGGAAIRTNGSTSSDGTPKTSVTVGADATLSANFVISVSRNSTNTAYGVELHIYGTLNGITGNGSYNEGSIGISVNGYIKAPASSSEVVPVINIYEGAKISVAEGTSGNINGDDAPALYAAGYAKWNISGGTITGSEALSIKAGEFNITGGTFTATGKYVYPPAAYNDGSEATGSAISITSNTSYQGNIDINISNATVESKNGYALSEATTQGTSTAINSMQVTSGDFSGNEDVGAVLVENIDEVGSFIEGGTFSSDIEEYIDTDSLTSVEEDGVFYVGVENEIEIKETTNGTVAASAEKAVEGQPIKLTITPATGYEVATVKVTSATAEVEVVNNAFTMPNSKVTVEVTFSEIKEEEEDSTDNSLPGESIQQPEEKEEVKDEKDETPKTGSLNITLYVSLAIIVIALVGIVTAKKASKHSK